MCDYRLPLFLIIVSLTWSPMYILSREFTCRIVHPYEYQLSRRSWSFHLLRHFVGIVARLCVKLQQKGVVQYYFAPAIHEKHEAAVERAGRALRSAIGANSIPLPWLTSAMRFVLVLEINDFAKHPEFGFLSRAVARVVKHVRTSPSAAGRH